MSVCAATDDIAIEHGPVVWHDPHDGRGYCAECHPAYDIDYYVCSDCVTSPRYPDSCPVCGDCECPGCRCRGCEAQHEVMA